MLKDKVLRFAQKHTLIEKGDTIFVAVSGGPDSMALLHWLTTIKQQYSLHIIVLSIDHQLRGQSSKDDLQYVEAMCNQWDIPFKGTSLDVASYKEQMKKGTQLAARELRYAFFQQMMEKSELPKLAMGHHGDDLVETMFMQLGRGMSPKGIPVKRTFANGWIIRPLLCLEKDEIEHYCVENDIVPRRDESNEETTYTRNAIRKTVLPFLKDLNPSISENLLQVSLSKQEDERFLLEEAKKVMTDVVEFSSNPKEAKVKINHFTTYPRPLQRRVFHLILNYLYNNMVKNVTSLHIDDIFSLLEMDKPNSTLHFPNGLSVNKAYNELVFRFSHSHFKPYHIELNPHKPVQLPNGSRLTLEYIEEETFPNELGDDQFVCGAQSLTFPLIVRTRKKGDKMKVRGLNGHKKVKDIFIDQKVPKHLRDEWPIVCDQEDQVLWVAGLKKGEPIENNASRKWVRITLSQNDHT
ncbi:tRNA lysidine(34) synthetase TilS [Salirhabdus salicampi]|uniref:tRNA lysidine(34) synthetase TilS n=1 Tax=Salirhabdus salicampi TaxID=476102 RepID=UPI0020C20B2A|nr:tRNA lysidine(34) synthetase TilS [Salirhabdus salicampi]MCP8618188.1 tRNA lysidine(34) synthetase TilS [Salirhabdus salicampi]